MICSLCQPTVAEIVRFARHEKKDSIVDVPSVVFGSSSRDSNEVIFFGLRRAENISRCYSVLNAQKKLVDI